jgi:hypothetical protein
MVSQSYQFEDDSVWSVCSDFQHIDGPVVIVPVNQIEVLSNEEVGKRARELVDSALLIDAEQKAYTVMSYGDNATDRSRYLDTLLELKPFLEKYAGASKNIDYALSIIEDTELYVGVRKPKIVKPKAKRKGYVYLIAGGGYFKIGLTSNLATRHKQIGSKLPFKTTLIHAIQTNDMEKTEAYWHERFSQNRAEGEWFQLTESEVSEFCLQQEM